MWVQRAILFKCPKLRLEPRRQKPTAAPTFSITTRANCRLRSSFRRIIVFPRRPIRSWMHQERFSRTLRIYVCDPFHQPKVISRLIPTGLYQDVVNSDQEIRPSWREKRLSLWHNFNHTWLDLLLRQLDLSRQELETGQRPSPPQSRISRNFLEKMGNELMRLGNGDLATQGLIDCGECGVWHEQIVDRMYSVLAWSPGSTGTESTRHKLTDLKQ